MPREMMYAEAMQAAIVEEMQRDRNVIFYGQNLGMTERDPMVRKFGKSRVRITPISETAEIGMAVGAALSGLRPVVELYMSEFMLVAMGQVLNEAPRLRYMSGGQVSVPLVLKGGLRLRRRLGRPALQLHLPHHDGHRRAEDRHSFHRRRR